MRRFAPRQRDDDMMRRASEIGDGMGMAALYTPSLNQETMRLEDALAQLARDCKAFLRARPFAVLIAVAVAGIVAARFAR